MCQHQQGILTNQIKKTYQHFLTNNAILGIWCFKKIITFQKFLFLQGILTNQNKNAYYGDRQLITTKVYLDWFLLFKKVLLQIDTSFLICSLRYLILYF